jgi:hypothetical protein
MRWVTYSDKLDKKVQENIERTVRTNHGETNKPGSRYVHARLFNNTAHTAGYLHLSSIRELAQVVLHIKEIMYQYLSCHSEPKKYYSALMNHDYH